MDDNSNLIVRFELVEVDDSGEIQTVRGQGLKGQMFGGKKFKIPRQQSYGHTINPPAGSLGVAIAFNGNVDEMFVAWCEHPSHRPTSMEPGEQQLYDDQGQYLKIARDKIEVKTPMPINIESSGTITIKAPHVVIDSADIKLGGAGATRELALKDSVDTGGDKEATDLSTRVKAI